MVARLRPRTEPQIYTPAAFTKHLIQMNVCYYIRYHDIRSIPEVIVITKGFVLITWTVKIVKQLNLEVSEPKGAAKPISPGPLNSR